MSAETTWTVKFTDRTGKVQDTATVRVSQDGFDPSIFYATGKWGCGKNASTPEGAIRMLVQDMAQILSMTKVG